MHKGEARDIAEALSRIGRGRVLTFITNHALANRGDQREEIEMKKDTDQLCADGIVRPGPTPFEKELSVEVRITALDGAHVKAFRITPEELETFESRRFIWSEILGAIVSGLSTDKRLRRDHVEALGIADDLGETEDMVSVRYAKERQREREK